MNILFDRIVSRVRSAAAQEVRRQADSGTGGTYLDLFVTAKDSETIGEDIRAALTDVGSAVAPAILSASKEPMGVYTITLADTFSRLNNNETLHTLIEDYIANYCAARWLEVHNATDISVKRYDVKCANLYERLPRLIAQLMYETL